MSEPTKRPWKGKVAMQSCVDPLGKFLITDETGEMVCMAQKPYALAIIQELNSYEAMKAALLALLHEPMSERAVDQARAALALANKEPQS